MAATRTPVHCAARLARLALHLVRGLAIAWLRYPRLTEATSKRKSAAGLERR